MGRRLVMEKFDKVTGEVVLLKLEDGYVIHDDACFICGSLGVNEVKVADMIQRVNGYNDTIEMLKKLEWSVITDFGNNLRCPMCKGLKTEGHKHSCKLNIMLQMHHYVECYRCIIMD